MTNLHSTRHEARGRAGQGPSPTWRPAADTTPVRSRAGAKSGPAEDPAALLVGDRLALTVTEAAGLLGISRALAYELVARGELPSIRLGRRLVVPKVALLEMLGLRPGREV
jgi:excisionase family DNA binding protein